MEDVANNILIKYGVGVAGVADKRRRAPNDIENQRACAEYMINCSARVAYYEYTKAVEGVSNDYDIAKAALDEDAARLYGMMNGKEFTPVQNQLPLNNRDFRARMRGDIELQNFDIIKLSVEALPSDIDHMLTLGFGSIYLAPFYKAAFRELHGKDVDYDILKYSGRDGGDYKGRFKGLNDVMRPERVKKIPNGNVLLFDDNIFSGISLEQCKKIAAADGINVKTGAAGLLVHDRLIAEVWDTFDYSSAINGYYDSHITRGKMVDCIDNALNEYRTYRPHISQSPNPEYPSSYKYNERLREIILENN